MDDILQRALGAFWRHRVVGIAEDPDEVELTYFHDDKREIRHADRRYLRQLRDPNRVSFPTEDLVYCQRLRLEFHYWIWDWYKSMEDLLALRVCHRGLCDSPLFNIEPVRAMFTALLTALNDDYYLTIRDLVQIREEDGLTDSDEE